MVRQLLRVLIGLILVTSVSCRLATNKLEVNSDDSESPTSGDLPNVTPPNILISNLVVTEGQAALITVSLSKVSDQDVTFDWSTADGTALQPGDYAAVSSSTETISAGNISVVLNITTQDDSIYENSQNFYVNLSNVNGAQLTNAQVQVSISDNDSVPNLSIDDVVVTEGATLAFTASLDASSEVDVTFDWSTADGTALQPGDYTAVSSSTETISAGSTSVVLNVTTQDDSIYENSQNMVVNLSNVNEATLLDGQGLATINDNDTAPSLSIDNVVINEGSLASFTVTQSAVTEVNTSFDWATADNTALQPGDYTAVSSTSVSITAGNTTKSLNVTTIDDADAENSESFYVNLSNPSGATISDAQGEATLNANDTSPFTWTGLGADDNWTTVGNWHGGAAPGTGDQAVFNATCTNCNANIDSNVDIGGLNLQSDYTGVITQNTGVTITLGSQGWSQAAGTFIGGDANITIDSGGGLSLTGGTLTSTTANFRIFSAIVNTYLVYSGSATFNHNNGSFEFDGGTSGSRTFTLIPSKIMTFNDLTFDRTNNANYTNTYDMSAGQFIVLGNLHIEATVAGSIKINNGTIEAKQNISSGSGANAGSALLKLNGTVSQTYSSTSTSNGFPNVEIDKSSGTVTPLGGTAHFYAGSLTLTQGNFTASPANTVLTYDIGTGTPLKISTGTTFTHNNGSLVIQGGGGIYSTQYIDVDSSLTLNHLTLDRTNVNNYGSTFDLSGDTLNVLGNFSLIRTGAGGNKVNSGTINVSGDVNIGGSAVSGGSANLTFNGTNDQSLTTSGGTPPQGTITVNKASGTLSLGSAINFSNAGQDLNIQSGTLNMKGYDLTVNDVLTINSGASLLEECGTLTYGTLSNSGTLDTTCTPPEISISDVRASESSNLVFTISINKVYGSNVLVDYTTTDGTATTAGTDYTLNSGSATITAGNTSTTVTVVVNDDASAESDETLTVDLSNPTNGTISDAQGVGTIEDNEMTAFTWTGLGVDDNWSTVGNWNGGAAPGSSDIAIFNGLCTNCNVAIDVSINVLGLHLKSNYTGTMTQNNSATMTIGIQGWSVAGGTFTGGDSAITIGSDGSLTHVGGVLTSTSGDLIFTCYNTGTYFTYSGSSTFNHNSGSLVFTGGKSGNKTYILNLEKTLTLNNLSFSRSLSSSYNSSYSLSSGSAVVLGEYDMHVSSGGNIIVNTGTIEAKGDVVSGLGASGGSAILKVNGSGTQTYSSVAGTMGFPTLILDKASGAFTPAGGTANFSAAALLIDQGSFTASPNTTRLTPYDSGTVFSIASGASFTHNSGTMLFGGGRSSVTTYTVSMASPITFNNVSFNRTYSSSYTSKYSLSGGTLTALGDLSVLATSNGTMAVDNGTINVEGHVSTSTGANGGTAQVVMQGTNAQTLTSTTGILPTGTMTINKSSGNVTLGSAVNLSGTGQDFTLQSGTLLMSGYAFTVNDVLTLESGTVLTKGGGALTYGSLTNNGGTINP